MTHFRLQTDFEPLETRSLFVACLLTPLRESAKDTQTCSAQAQRSRADDFLETATGDSHLLKSGLLS